MKLGCAWAFCDAANTTAANASVRHRDPFRNTEALARARSGKLRQLLVKRMGRLKPNEIGTWRDLSTCCRHCERVGKDSNNEARKGPFSAAACGN